MLQYVRDQDQEEKPAAEEERIEEVRMCTVPCVRSACCKRCIAPAVNAHDMSADGCTIGKLTSHVV